uniref:Venom lipase 1 n=1 Tax=Ectomocoris sp. TaxID=3104572 RepID=A0AB38ZEC5_9HEMI
MLQYSNKTFQKCLIIMRIYKVYRILPIILVLFVIYCFNYSLADCGDKCENPLSWGEWFRSFKNPLQDWKVPDLVAFLGKDKLPKDEDDKDQYLVKFWLFNRNNMKNPELFLLDTNTTMFKQFDPKKQTRIIVHGWIGNVNSKFSVALINAYLPTFDYNVIVVDWGSKARTFYPTARNSVAMIGKLLSDFLNELCTTFQLKPESLHLVGHSLGAHVAGVAGLFMRNGLIGRISGLDPAYPLFAPDHSDRLTSKSAIFVDVIHTCGKYLGWFGQVGHADFYPNKGTSSQPGCGMDVLGKCSHRRAWMYYAESIVAPKKFMAVPCVSWKDFEDGSCLNSPVNMGEYLPTNTRGIFYLKTNKDEPFGRGLNII